MTLLISIVVVLAMSASALGWGTVCLWMLGLRDQISRTQVWAWGFVLGMCLIGWLAQPLCLLFGVGYSTLLMTVLPGLAGLILVPRPSRLATLDWTWISAALLLAGLLLVLGDLSEALVPPCDADSLGYHFALPKQYLEQGQLFFTPRALDGAVPLLLQMTYMVALGLGGEQALTLWCGVTGWSLAFAAWAFARPYLSRERTWLLVLILQALPAVLYGAGSGQVETRLAALALVALSAAATAAGMGNFRFAAVAGFTLTEHGECG